MANVIFPGEHATAAVPHNPQHRNVTSGNHPMLGTAGDGRPEPPPTGRRAVRGRPDTVDLLAGPAEDAPQQKLVGVSSLRARGLGPGPQRDIPVPSPESGRSAGRQTHRDENMGALLFGGVEADRGASSQPPTARGGKRRGPVDYSEYQLRMPPAPAGGAAPQARARSVGPPSSVGLRDGIGFIGGGDGPRARAQQPSAVPDALDQHMHGDAHMQELAAKHAAISREVRALPRDKDGMIAEISQVADALRKQGLLLSVAGFSELLARCDIEPTGFPNFDDFMGCLMREDGPAPLPTKPPAEPEPEPNHAVGPELDGAHADGAGELPHFHMPNYDDPRPAPRPAPPGPQYAEEEARPPYGGAPPGPPRTHEESAPHEHEYGRHAPGAPTAAMERMRIDGGAPAPTPSAAAPARAQQQGQPRMPAPYAQHDDDDVPMRRVPGSRAPIASKDATWATSANSYGRYLTAVPVHEINAHVGRNQKPSTFTRHEPRREANSGFMF
eukprot:CAMPEP_0119422800 /NCGR_PEP_ID=MMETSP1335-20130426/28931_1 /TAXON_ID=259385 /ORGANISM="Chrysoculter rhomboideus, Strain RCC1486" /LENGTH=498 /DNA_ID=CAMNT_0007448265 /DNA_START=42 /DNA_END=1538 /DNA_ORIENTATION=+